MGNLGKPIATVRAKIGEHDGSRFFRPLCVVAVSPRLIAMLIALILVSAGTVEAKSWGYDLAAELMSPYCPGRTLASCPSPQAAELVQWMVLQEAAGSSQEEVIAVLIERFGEEILGSPPAKGITLWAYIFPILGFVVGGGLVVIAMRRIVGGDAGGNAADEFDSLVPASVSSAPIRVPNSASPSSATLGDDELARMVDEDLAARG